ncbi:hypothetical protein HYPSUDRAFT_88628 [Hypholoma sublateritium FD-334 SS-4]|uniref:WSC domain-containing protein n=1 Tax=Hypholoma sublateritium (strain FD-334 SS-4) TaxID=945553 RepID=A0A0D2PKN7_HYPSF|nr:hypothetical protein HYPSUDRAFT_88628 [Hypholoma sublateritium FD-334 SS-4]
MLLELILLVGVNAILTRAQYSFVGCIAQGTFGSRLALLGPQVTTDIMDVNFCQQACLTVNANFAAVYNGCVIIMVSRRMCGNTTTNNGASGALINPGNCATPCVANPRDSCGDTHSAGLYSRTSVTTNGWISAGCFTDNSTFPALPTLAASSNFNSMEFCTSTCSELGFSIAGMEMTQCFCGNDLLSSDGIAGQRANQVDCNSPCLGASSQFCGGVNRLSIWTTG